MPLPPDLAAWLREEGHDATHAAELHMNQSSDSGILPRLENSWVRGGLRHQSVLHRRPVKARRFNEVEAALNC
jgi:hypothetical protein